MDSDNKINCNGIPYRLGFIEVQPNIHNCYANQEAWVINPEVKLKGINIGSSTIKDSDFTGNDELELDLETAKTLIKKLHQAISEIEGGDIA